MQNKSSVTESESLLLDAVFEADMRYREVEFEWEFSCPVCGIACETREKAIACCYALLDKTCNFEEFAVE